jgi:cation:H+ antiporter
MVLNLVLFLLSFLGLWFSSDLIITAVKRFSHQLKVSAFATSFFILGFLTSLPEISVGVSAVLDREPEIFVGDLIGASFVLFVFIIPILAILGNGIKLTHQLTHANLLMSLFVVITPVIFTLDGRVSWNEGIFMIIAYIFLLYFIEKRKGLLEKAQDILLIRKEGDIKDLTKIVAGALLLFLSSKILVDNTIYLAKEMGIAPLLISLVVISVGTNLPELFIAVKSIVKKQKDIALGDYVGSAAANTLIFGGLTLWNGSFVIRGDGFFSTFLIFLSGLILFYLFSRSKRDISKTEGLILLIVYIFFLMTRLFFFSGGNG